MLACSWFIFDWLWCCWRWCCCGCCCWWWCWICCCWWCWIVWFCCICGCWIDIPLCIGDVTSIACCGVIVIAIPWCWGVILPIGITGVLGEPMWAGEYMFVCGFMPVNVWLMQLTSSCICWGVVEVLVCSVITVARGDGEGTANGDICDKSAWFCGVTGILGCWACEMPLCWDEGGGKTVRAAAGCAGEPCGVCLEPDELE